MRQLQHMAHGACMTNGVNAAVDLAALCLLDEVTTNEIEKIIRLLSQPQHTAGPRPA
jgi:hypothetical protein